MKKIDGYKTFDGVIFESAKEAISHEEESRMDALDSIMLPMIKALNITRSDFVSRLLPHINKYRGNLAIALSIGD